MSEPTPEIQGEQQGVAAEKKSGGKGYLLRKLKAAEKASESAKSEAEQLRQKLLDAQAKAEEQTVALQQERVKFAFEREAAKAGVIDTEAAFKLADVSKVGFDAQGALQGVPDVLKGLKEARPYLFSQPSAARGTGGGNPPGGSLPLEVTPQRIKSMTDSEFAEFHQAVSSGKIRL